MDRRTFFKKTVAAGAIAASALIPSAAVAGGNRESAEFDPFDGVEPRFPVQPGGEWNEREYAPPDLSNVGVLRVSDEYLRAHGFDSEWEFGDDYIEKNGLEGAVIANSHFSAMTFSHLVMVAHPSMPSRLPGEDVCIIGIFL